MSKITKAAEEYSEKYRYYTGLEEPEDWHACCGCDQNGAALKNAFINGAKKLLELVGADGRLTDRDVVSLQELRRYVEDWIPERPLDLKHVEALREWGKNQTKKLKTET